MKMNFQKLVIGASMAIGVSALATAPAHATSFSFDNTAEINTYTGTSKGDFIRGNAAGGTDAAIKALTDNDSSSNVELWYSSENPAAGSYASFTATQGDYKATVSSITADDWKIFGSQWVTDLVNAYTPFQSVWNGFSDTTKSLITSSFSSLGIGDPNIGGFQFGQNGGVQVQLVGNLDVTSKLSTTISNNLNTVWSGGVGAILNLGVLPISVKLQADVSASDVQAKISLLQASLKLATDPQKQKLQSQIDALTSYKDLLNFQATLNGYTGAIGVSEIAKVVTGGTTSYAYSFKPTASGITASDDGVSYSAYYTWNTPGYIAPLKQVPEPSIILGLLGVAGVFATQRKFKKASI
ncbi:MAG: NF038130 family PEP-CTERM protein [Nostoc sp.]|uniref:NF038130 family PEP-CTERM protein n=1 Tax=Nostoc sp. TaxID=1180 RepID=UPI002FFA4343